MTRFPRRSILSALGAGLALGAGGHVLLDRLSGPDALAPAVVFAEDGVAIRGTDAVAYFAEKRPVAGAPRFALSWQGVEWRFASAANRDAFGAEPTAYAPQYGGFCAWAVAAKGELYSTQPRNWAIVGGRLYLNFSDEIQERWQADIPGFIDAGDRRWREIVARA